MGFGIVGRTKGEEFESGTANPKQNTRMMHLDLVSLFSSGSSCIHIQSDSTITFV